MWMTARRLNSAIKSPSVKTGFFYRTAREPAAQSDVARSGASDFVAGVWLKTLLPFIFTAPWAPGYLRRAGYLGIALHHRRCSRRGLSILRGDGRPKNSLADPFCTWQIVRLQEKRHR